MKMILNKLKYIIEILIRGLDMEKDIFLNTMKNALIEWCEKREENSNDIDFSNAYCTGKTYIRFTTKVIDSILPPSNDNKGSWKNGHFIFYEIDNRVTDVIIRCVISQKDISPRGKEICELLVNVMGENVKSKDWQYKYLKKWKVYKYHEDEKIEGIIKNINIALNDIFENDIGNFERKLSVSLLNEIKEEDNQLKYDDELKSVVIEKGDLEGSKIKYFTTKYERSIKNRLEAINIHGTKCMVCGFDFESMYGEWGKGFIEVHHIKPLFDLEEEICINPLTDLVCLCSNCHRIIHRKKDSIFSIEELRELIKSNK